MSWMNRKLADIIEGEIEGIDPRLASAAAGAIIEYSGDLWEDCAEHEPPVGENLLWLGPKGGMFLGVRYGDMNPDGTVWVKSMNGGRKARFWMEAPKGKVEG